MLFAELLKARAQLNNWFVGHIGGDDFFMSFKGLKLDTAVNEVVRISQKFRSNVESFYDKEAIRKGCIEAVDRDGQYRCMPLMSISAAVMELPASVHRIYSPEEIGKIMAQMKKNAKNSPDHMCVSTLKHFESLAESAAELRQDNLVELADYRKTLESK